ncbi:hypothetical protein [Hymenobacter fodinae]|uniref:hypothetical protein n=1 Tax=Hymenobacter fodinae TaxID=2510796 RepID=UPI0014368F4A|nr:hypothetical protein [Hymenobacter fodinae]
MPARQLVVLPDYFLSQEAQQQPFSANAKGNKETNILSCSPEIVLYKDKWFEIKYNYFVDI